MKKLSLCMIVKNEEKYLAKCLSSIKDVTDEIVMVDTGSSDRTIEIAESFGAKIFHFDWINDFSAARNFALSKCSGDWILYLDADEELNSNSIKGLHKYLDGKFAGIYCTVRSLGSDLSTGSIMKYPRLFPNDSRLIFSGKVHEQIEDSLIKNKISKIDSDIEIIHHGYVIDETALKQKKERNLALLLSTENEQTNVYDLLKLIQTLSSLGKYDEAEKRLNKLFANRFFSTKHIGLAFFYMASIKYDKNELKSALDYALKAYLTLPDKPELNYLIYLIYLRIDAINDALKYLKNSIKLNKNLLESKNLHSSENILDQIDLYLRAINLNFRLNSETDAQKFIYDLSDFIAREKHLDINVVYPVFEDILLNYSLMFSNLNLLSNLISSSHLSNVLEIVKRCKDDLLLIGIINSLLQNFPDSSILYKNLALLYFNTDQEKAIELLNKSLEFGSDPSVYFHLIALYLSINDYNKVKESFDLLQIKFSQNPQFKQKIDNLKEKLSSILNTTQTLQTT